MELEKIRNLSDGELVTEEKKAAEQLFRLRFQMKLGQNEGVKKLRETEEGHRAHQDDCTRARAGPARREAQGRVERAGEGCGKKAKKTSSKTKKEAR